MMTWIPSAIFQAWRLMRTRRYDLIHTHFLLPSGVVAYVLHQMTGIPYVVTAHGSDVPGYNPDRFRGIHRLLTPAWQRIVSSARAITCPSRWLADLIETVARDAPPIRIIPNGISEEMDHAGKEAAPHSGRELALRAQGRAVPAAGPAGGPTGPCHPYRGRRAVSPPGCRSSALDVPDRVVFHGWLENHSSELKRLVPPPLPCSCSLRSAENFPISLLEAMLSGNAIVASDLPACREVLGDAALYARPGDVESLRKQLLSLVNESERATGMVRSRASAFSKFRLASHRDPVRRVLHRARGVPPLQPSRLVSPRPSRRNASRSS